MGPVQSVLVIFLVYHFSDTIHENTYMSGTCILLNTSVTGDKMTTLWLAWDSLCLYLLSYHNNQLSFLSQIMAILEDKLYSFSC